MRANLISLVGLFTTVSLLVPTTNSSSIASPGAPQAEIQEVWESQLALTRLAGTQQPTTDRVLWRFRVDANYISHRVGIGPDGTVYANDYTGKLYAIAPDGILKWMYDSQGAGDEGPVSVGRDGTIYFVSDPLGPTCNILALNPDGTLKWTFTDPNTQGVIAGPNVGPDGNIYVVTDSSGLGAFSLTPDGRLRWNHSGFLEYGQVGEEIAFGRPGQVYFGFDTAPLPEGLYGLRLDGTPRFGIRTGGVSRLDQPQPATGPDGTVYVNIAWRLNAYSPAGQFKWSFFGDGTNVLTAPDVDRNGVTYIGQNLSYLYAVNPNGTERWHVTDSGIIEQGPVVNPANTLMVVGGQITYGQPGLIQAYSTAGVLLWTEQLPPENNEQIVPYARARYSPDGLVAYLPTATLGLSQDDYSYIYAVRVTP